MEEHESVQNVTVNDLSTDEMLMIGGVKLTTASPIYKMMTDMSGVDTSRPHTRSGDIQEQIREEQRLKGIPMLHEEAEEMMMTPKDNEDHEMPDMDDRVDEESEEIDEVHELGSDSPILSSQLKSPGYNPGKPRRTSSLMHRSTINKELKTNYENFDHYVNSYRGYDDEYQEEQSKALSQRKVISKLEIYKGVPVVYPFYLIPYNSRKRDALLLVYLCAIIFEIFNIPLFICFQGEGKASLGLRVISWLFYSIHVFDFLCQFLITRFNKAGDELLGLREIKRENFKSVSFYLKCIALLPVHIVLEFNSEELKPYRAFYLLRLASSINFWLIFERFQEKTKHTVKLRVLEISLSLVIFLHYFASLWFLLVRLQYSREKKAFEAGEIGELDDESEVWAPISVLIIIEQRREAIEYFYSSSGYEKYGFTVYSLMMLSFGNDLGCVQPFQVALLQ